MPKSRAQENGVSTKSLRRMAANRLQKFRNSVLAMRQAWGDLEDESISAAFDSFDSAIDGLESDLAGLIEYHDLPIGSEG